jgi:hypothetical protein
MTSLEESQPLLSQREEDHFAAVDQVVRRWWVAIFLALMVTAWWVHGVSA